MNNGYRIAPWADAVYAMDAAWWVHHLAEVVSTFTGRRLSNRQRPGTTVIRTPYLQQGAGRGQNSGAGAIAVAVAQGATRIVLLGYDCQYGPDGLRHWHGDHPPGTGSGNAGNVGRWPAQFRELVPHLRGATVINASRATALTVFPRQPLETALACN